MSDFEYLTFLRWLYRYEEPSTDYYEEGSRFEFEAACVAAVQDDEPAFKAIIARFEKNHPGVPTYAQVRNAEYLRLTIDEVRAHEKLMLQPMNQWPSSLYARVTAAWARLGMSGDVAAVTVADWIREAR